MTKKTVILSLYSLAVAISIGVLTALGQKYLFPDWAARNSMLMYVILGAMCGGSYALVSFLSQRKK